MTAKNQVDAVMRRMMKSNNKEPAVKEVRRGLVELVRLFSGTNFRLQLATECGASNVVLKRQALSLLWKNVLTVAMIALKSLRSKKPQLQEYKQFSTLLLLYSPSDAAANTGEKDVRPRLSLETISKVKDFVFGLFQEEDIVEIAERELLLMLHAICSRRDFVGVFRSGDFDNVMDILEPRLDVITSIKYQMTYSTVEAAARSLEALVNTCATVGVSLHDHISECIFWVAQRCQSYVTHKTEKGGDTAKVTVIVLLRTAATLMSFEPDQAIGPLRKYGGNILGVARRIYPGTSGANKDTVVGYMMAHLIVCQVAGTFQGLPTGDLGDVGKGSLTKKTLQGLVKVVATEKEIKIIMAETTEASNSRKNATRIWKPLHERRRRHLELCARLVACLQRLFLVEEIWKAANDPVDDILESIEFDDRPESQMSGSTSELSTSLRVSTMARSPFVELVLFPLSSAVGQSSQNPSPSVSFSQNSNMSSGNVGMSNEDHLLVLLDEQKADDKRLYSIIAFLQLLCACSECFPLGECWSSGTSGNWATFQAEDPLRDDAFKVRISSPDDLAIVVVVAGRILESAGKPGGESDVQIWVLRCLLQLAESSACISSTSHKSLGSLTLAWQSIWHSLLRPTLQYVSFTKTTTPFSCGELIIALLGKIIQFGCTDLAGKRSSFLSSEMHTIWNLPTFSDSLAVGSPVVFDLIRSALYQFGISDDIVVSADPTLLSSIFSNANLEMQDGFGEDFKESNRVKLLCFSLRRLCAEIARERKNESCEALVTSLLACCLSTVFGKSSSTMLSQYQIDLRLLQLSSPEFRVTNLKARPCELFVSDASEHSVRGHINWKQPVTVLDTVQESAFRSRQMLQPWAATRGNTNGGFVNKHQSRRMQKFSIEYLSMMFSDESHESLIFNETNTSFDNAQNRTSSDLIGRICSLRCCLSLALGDKTMDISSCDFAKNVIANSAAVVAEFVGALKSPTDSIGNGHMLTCIEALISEFIRLVPREAGHQHLKAPLVGLGDMCRDLLDGFNRSFIQIDEKQLSSTSKTEEDNLSEDDQEDLGEFPEDATSARRPQIESTPTKRRRTRITSVILDSLTAASSVASILIMLEPTTATCRFVYEQLSIFESVPTNFSNRQESCIDLEAAKLSLMAVCTKLDILIERSADDSALALCLQIITEVRHGAHGGDDNFAAGFEEVALVLERCPVSGISSDNADSLIGVLLMSEVGRERAWLKMRPLLSVQRLTAAIAAYDNCGPKFRDTFQRSFASEFVIESLNAEATHVRLKSAHALGLALRYLERQRFIYANVYEALALGKMHEAGTPVLRTLCDAQKGKDASSCWKSSSASIRYCLLRLWGVMAGCTSDTSVFQERLFDCILFAGSNKSLEPVCQIALQKVGALRGYASTEGLIRDETEHIFERWISAKKSPESVPVNFSSNALMSTIIDWGLSCVDVWGILDSQTLQIEKLSEQATAEFVFASVSMALPVCLSGFSPADFESFRESNLSAVPSDVMSYLDALNDISRDNDQSPRSTMGLVTEHASSILAYGILEVARVKSCESNDLIKFAFALASSISDDQGRKDLLLSSVRQLLATQGREQSSTLCSAYSHANLLELDRYAPKGWPKVASIVRDSAVELLTICRYWLDRAQIDSHKVSRWNTMEMIIRMILVDGKTTVFVKDLALRSVLGLLRSDRFHSCHLKILLFVKGHLINKIDQLVFNGRSQILAFQLVGTLLHVHERCQERLMNLISDQCERKGIHETRSFGILLDRTNTKKRGWNDEKTATTRWIQNNIDCCLAVLSPVEKELASATYDLLRDVLDAWISREDKREAANTKTELASFVREGGRYEALVSLNEKYGAQNLLKRYVESSRTVSVRDQLSAAASRFTVFKQHMSLLGGSTSYATDAKESLTLDERLLLDQTSFLSRTLTSCDVTTRSELFIENYNLTRHLFDIVSSETNSPELRIEASKCLGHVGPAFIGSLSELDRIVDDKVNLLNSAEKDDLMASMISQALEFLLARLKSEQPTSSLTCLQACKEIVSTQQGIDAVMSMEPGDGQDFMKTLVLALGGKVKKKPTLLTPSTRFVDSAIKTANSGNDSHDDTNDWCWAETLWDVTNTTFDKWIQRLVSSIIICCYGRRVLPEGTRGSSLSFRALASISAISSSIAAFLLPQIILDVLLSDTTPLHGVTKNYATVQQSWVGHPHSLATKKVSDAFNHLARSLEKCSDIECRSKASNVMSSTLDLLRRISQKRFLHHKFKPSTLKVVANVKSKPRRFGSVLKFAQETAVKTFIASSKVASASYYAETALFESGLHASASREHIVNANSERMRASQNALMVLLHDCMLKLEEPDAASAYSLKIASVGFMRNDFCLADHMLSHSTPAEKFQFLSVERSTTDKNALEIAQCLGDLGSMATLTAYSNAISRQQSLSDESRNCLKETWFKSKLTTMEWADTANPSSLEHKVEGNEQGFFGSLFGALSSLRHGDKSLFAEHVATCRYQALLQCSQRDGRESMITSLLPMVERFEILNDLDILHKGGSCIPPMLARWEKEASDEAIESVSTSFVQGEFKLAVRENMISIIAKVGGLEVPGVDTENYLINHLWLSASIGREQGRLEFAERCLQRSERIINSSESPSRLLQMKVHLEKAKLMESRGYFKPAIQTTKLITHAIEDQMSNISGVTIAEWRELRADSLLSCGIWTRKHRVESAKYVQKHYLEPAAKVCSELWAKSNSIMDARRIASSYLALAQNAAALFENVNSHIKSKEWKAKRAFLENQRIHSRELEQEFARIGRKNELPEDARHRSGVKCLISCLKEELRKEEDDLAPHAILALKAFGEALSICDSSSHENWTQHVFQMVSIWFSSHQIVGVNAAVDSFIAKIPSFRFVPLMYQLFSRMSSKEVEEWDEFQVTLRELVRRMCHEHPYHCLLQLLALKNGGVGNDLDPKVRAANAVMMSLRANASANQEELYEAYEIVHEAYHLLAMANPSEADLKKRNGLLICKAVKVKDRQLQSKRLFHKIDCRPCVFTKPPTLLENHDYGDFKSDPLGSELIAGFSEFFDITPSGLHHPKIVECKGSGGTVFKQLVKGKDDIRQDAVMEQVFTYTNELMRRRTASKPSTISHERKGTSRSVGKTLKLVTYNIVPLTPESGVLEWVNDSQPLNDYLTGDGKKNIGAHSRYAQGEWHPRVCSQKLKNAKPGEKRQVFDEICRNFSPVFRYFFVEMFGHDLQKWHTAKMAYIRSCAVSSIVGHILGIGDRHGGNILVHKKTGEIVHIDFGIVFDQGRNLPIPETVPFRLTRDIVDGMGPLGIEGTFTTAAEETTEILRNNSNALLTILSAVVNDPLYEWKKSGTKARARQAQQQLEEGHTGENRSKPGANDPDIDDPEDNLAAMHAIARIKEKLQGYEEGTSSEQLSVDGQVQLLINSARDHDNLCSIFYGWASFQ